MYMTVSSLDTVNNGRLYFLDEISMTVVDTGQAFVEIRVTTLYQQWRIGWTVSLIE